MEQVNNSRGKSLRIIAGIAFIVCAIISMLANVVYSVRTFVGTQINLSYYNIYVIFVLPYVNNILQILFGVLLLKNNLKGVLIIAAIKFVIASLNISISILLKINLVGINNFIYVISIENIFSYLFYAAGFYLSLIALLRQKTNNKAGYVLSIVFFVLYVWGAFFGWVSSSTAGGSPTMFVPFISLLHSLITLAADILLAIYLAFYSSVKPPKKIKMNTGANAFSQDYGDQDLVKFIILCIVTFGIWYYIWIYNTGKNLGIGGKSTDAGLELILVMFIPFYYIYWLYKASKNVEEQLKVYGRAANDVCAITLILGALVGFLFGIVFLQYKINELASIKRSIDVNANANINVSDVKKSDAKDI